mmetsp:Transcript_26571/g.81682  ORF Transcript_26571/g.81682 Transcript_26571/m.81682 type:complete len:725 (-) Transcript_26571:3492-5666(-)
MTDEQPFSTRSAGKSVVSEIEGVSVYWRVCFSLASRERRFLSYAVVVIFVVSGWTTLKDQSMRRSQQLWVERESIALTQANNDVGMLLTQHCVWPEAAGMVAEHMRRRDHFLLRWTLREDFTTRWDVVADSESDRVTMVEHTVSDTPHAVEVAQKCAYFREQRDEPLLAADVLSKTQYFDLGPIVATAALCVPHAWSKAELPMRYMHLLCRLDTIIAWFCRKEHRSVKVVKVDAVHLLVALPISWPYLGYSILPLHLRLAELFRQTTVLYDRRLSSSHFSVGCGTRLIAHRIDHSGRKKETQGRKVRLLVVTELGRNTSPGILFEEVLAGLCVERSESFDVVFAAPSQLDTPFALRARLLATETVSLPTSSAHDARNTLFEAHADVLLYLALGISTITYATAQARLAPVQIAFGHGHPVSSGLPDTIDYFVSSSDFESGGGNDDAVFQGSRLDVDGYGTVLNVPGYGSRRKEGINECEQVKAARRGDEVTISSASIEDGVAQSFALKYSFDTDENYSIGPRGDGAQAYAEHVVLFESRTIGVAQAKPLARLSRNGVFLYYFNFVAEVSDTTIDFSAPLLSCLQHSKKLHPDFDDALAATLRLTPDVNIVFLEGAKKHLPRWRRTVGDIIDRRVVFLSRSSRDAVLGLVAAVDVALDTYPWGGGVTVMEALAVCTPVTTLTNLTSVLQLAKGKCLLWFCCQNFSYCDSACVVIFRRSRGWLLVCT